MNILHITREQGSDARYGIRKSLYPVIEALRGRGHSVKIIDKKIAASLPSTKLEKWIIFLYLKLMYLKFGKSGNLALFLLNERIIIGLKAAKYAAHNNISHVHCHDPLLGYIYSFFALLYGATKNWGFTEHAFGRFVKLRIGIITSEKSLIYLQRWEEISTRKAKWVFTPTKSGFTLLMHDLSLNASPNNWHVIPNAVIKHTGKGALIRKSLKLKEDDKLLLAVGQLIPMKRFSLLLESVALIPTAAQPYILILGDGLEKEELYSLARKYNLSKRFEIRVTDNIGKYYSAADIYVSVSSTESFGMANCEAVLAGLPSICTAVDAVPELLNQCAIMVGDKPDEISSAIMKLLTSKEERNNLITKAQHITQSWPKPNEIAKMTEKVYHKYTS